MSREIEINKLSTGFFPNTSLSKVMLLSLLQLINERREGKKEKRGT
jgi:hypothetical protein